MTRPATHTLITIISLVASAILAPTAWAEEAATAAQNAAMAITRLVNEAESRRSELPSDAWGSAGTYIIRLNSHRSTLQIMGSALATKSSEVRSLKDKLAWLDTYADSAIARHKQAAATHAAKFRHLNSRVRNLNGRVNAHNSTRDRPRSRSEGIAYDAKARRLNNEKARLNQAIAAATAAQARELLPLRLEASKRAREYNLKLAEVKRALAAYNQQVSAMNAKINAARSDANALTSVLNRGLQQAAALQAARIAAANARRIAEEQEAAAAARRASEYAAQRGAALPKGRTADSAPVGGRARERSARGENSSTPRVDIDKTVNMRELTSKRSYEAAKSEMLDIRRKIEIYERVIAKTKKHATGIRREAQDYATMRAEATKVSVLSVFEAVGFEKRIKSLRKIAAVKRRLTGPRMKAIEAAISAVKAALKEADAQDKKDAFDQVAGHQAAIHAGREALEAMTLNLSSGADRRLKRQLAAMAKLLDLGQRAAKYAHTRGMDRDDASWQKLGRDFTEFTGEAIAIFNPAMATGLTAVNAAERVLKYKVAMKGLTDLGKALEAQDTALIFNGAKLTRLQERHAHLKREIALYENGK